MSEPISKTQRLLDLITYLAGRRIPATVEDIMEVVPSYDADRWREGTAKEKQTLRRQFERDKEELRTAGIPIESVNYRMGVHDSIDGYRLAHRDFYLPYQRLVHAQTAATSGPRSRDVEWTLDDMGVVLQSLRLAENIPGFPLRPQLRSAFRKLAFDLDLEAYGETHVLHATPVERAGSPASVQVLIRSAMVRKRVDFTYEGADRGATTKRSFDPYGTFLQHGQWYTVGHCHLRDGLRVFRVSRMSDVRENTRAPKTPDFVVPETFSLRPYLHREPWDVGGEGREPVAVEVRFQFPRSLWVAARDDGTLVATHEDGAATHRFSVTNTNPFLRWILSMAGEAHVTGPAELRAEFKGLARLIAERHGGGNHD
jgi:predicted DNA-binding transcriptional regulator YafY